MIFAWCVAIRRLAYRFGMIASRRLRAAVIVVGGISVGGTGKTPLVIWLVEALRERGFNPGVVSRGYRGASRGPRAVGAGDSAAEVGDEPLLIARRTGAPLWIGADRVAAGEALLRDAPACDVIVADDGLQHYRLCRDVEIAVIDAPGVGNGWLLPAGPLREPLKRLHAVDAVVAAAGVWPERVDRRSLARLFSMTMSGDRFYRLEDPDSTCGADELRGKRLHAVAGIGNPQRFFAHLARLGLRFERHSFSDHHRFRTGDLDFEDCDVIVMTEKDAVKCAGLARCETWVLPVDADVSPGLADFVVEKICGRQAS
jgi:tetraacyldisaccharide 4'-kinase